MFRLAMLAVLSVALAASLAPAATVAAQRPATPWWVGAFSIDGNTMLTLTADAGREVRSGARPGEIRHGLEVPLVVDPSGQRVELTLAGGASRWTLTRIGDEVVIEEWRLPSGPGGWARLRTVRVPLAR